jgi:predicted hotdog family 3-hydroxylacyl-ACP dehydratase
MPTIQKNANRKMDIVTLSDLSLDDLLPHRGNMMLVEKVLEVDSDHALTLCRVKKSWPMADDNGVHPLILLELAAQTAGVCNGWERIQTKGLDSEKMGWLVGIKKAEILVDHLPNFHLPFSSEIITRAENSYIFGNLREVSCESSIDNKIICKSTLQLFQA